MTPANQERFGKYGLAALCLIVAPVLIGLIHDDWLYTPISHLDPWFNVGYFLDYFDPTFRAHYYKEARLSWLAPGFILYKTFGPVAANFILHVGALALSAFVFYLAAARLVSRNAALLTAVLLVAYIPFHGSGGWDYQTTGSGLYFAVTIYCLVRAAQSPSAGPWLAAAGAAFAATFHANIIFVNMAPGLLWLYLAIARRDRNGNGVAMVAIWGLGGFLLLTIALCVFAQMAGRDPMFFQTLVDIVFNYTADPHKYMAQWWQPWSSGWFLQPRALIYMGPLFAIWVAGVAWTVVKLARRAPETEAPDEARGSDLAVRLAMVGQFLFVFVLWIIWQSLGHVALQPDYFAYPLIIPAFLALAALAGDPDRKAMIALGVGMAAVLVAASALSAAGVFWAGPAAILLVLALIAGVAAGAALPALRPLVVVAVAAVYLIAYTGVTETLGGTWPQVSFRAQCAEPRAVFKTIVRLNRLADAGQASRAQTWVWDGPDETMPAGQCDLPMSLIRGALTSTGVQPLGSIPSVAAESITDTDVRLPKYGDRLMAVVQDPRQLAAFEARFRDAGTELAVDQRETVDLGETGVVVAVYKVRP